MTKQHTNASSGPDPKGDGAPEKLSGGLVFGAVGDVPVYPGQSPKEVWDVAAILKREVDDLGHYSALALAREILRHVGSGGCRS